MLIMIIPGATPNETTSARESSCLPNSLEIERIRAAKPSKKSQTKAIRINAIAKSILPAKQEVMLAIPQAKLEAVRKLGILISGWRKNFMLMRKFEILI